MYSVPSGTAGKNSVIEWVKVEKGSLGTPWSANPGDAARIVDSTTEIEANVITSNHINVANLSAISANLGDVTAGSLKSNTIIDVETDLKVGENVELRSSAADVVRAINFRDSNGILDARIFKDTDSGGIVIQSNTFSSGVALDATMTTFGHRMEITFYENPGTGASGQFENKTWEKGYCGIGARDPKNESSAVAGVGVNFRIRKSYIPSSITLTPISDISFTVQPFTTEIREDGFWLYVKGVENAGNMYCYWRGYYQA
jgi:hypothetical protein